MTADDEATHLRRVIGTIVQVVNMPLVRATITIQDPKCNIPNVRHAIAHIYASKGAIGLWHGVSAGILKTVPKYITAVVVKDLCEAYLPRPADPHDRTAVLVRSAVKSCAAGICGAALTNPLDVIRNEYHTLESIVAAYISLSCVMCVGCSRQTCLSLKHSKNFSMKKAGAL